MYCNLIDKTVVKTINKDLYYNIKENLSVSYCTTLFILSAIALELNTFNAENQVHCVS